MEKTNIKILFFIILFLFFIPGISLAEKSSNNESAAENEVDNSTKIHESGDPTDLTDTEKVDSNTENRVKEEDIINEKKNETESPAAKTEHEKEIKKDKTSKNFDNTGVKKYPVVDNDKIDFRSSLLLIDGGNYKYKRIPNIKIETKKSNQIEEIDIVKIPDMIDEQVPETEKKGLFGFSKEVTDTIAKGALVLLILLIFILYKARSKSSNRKVLKSYPKK